MRQSLVATLLIVLAGGTAVATMQTHHGDHAAANPALEAAVAAPTRTSTNRLRDPYRHPLETLTFFGVKPGDTVVEMIPGGAWYSEILAPYLAASGKLYAAQPPGRAYDSLKARFGGESTFAKVSLVNLPATGAEIAPGSVDVVLTFRNMHNLVMAGDGGEAGILANVYAMLKPGGTFGVVDHRLPESRDGTAERTSGYLKVSTVRRVVEAAGFEYVGASEINANPRDTADYPKGVWTLPPTYREGDADRARYQAIGESDRMTLKFRKPTA